MLRLDAASRKALADLKAQERALKKPAQEMARAERKAAKRERDKAVTRSPGQRDPRRREKDYEAWLHQWPCIAGLIEGGCEGPIESAHQKLAIAKAGWREGGLGPRIHDARSVPLCAGHHRLHRNSCDLGGQRKFWDRLNIGDLIADFCRDLHQAFTSGGDGHAVIAKYVRIALTNREEAVVPRKETA